MTAKVTTKIKAVDDITTEVTTSLSEFFFALILDTCVSGGRLEVSGI
jgi:hypothetical protein